jgi:hypothetical protein
MRMAHGAARSQPATSVDEGAGGRPGAGTPSAPDWGPNVYASTPGVLGAAAEPHGAGARTEAV